MEVEAQQRFSGFSGEKSAHTQVKTHCQVACFPRPAAQGSRCKNPGRGLEKSCGWRGAVWSVLAAV